MQSKFRSLMATSHRRRVSSIFLAAICSMTSCQVRVPSLGSAPLIYTRARARLKHAYPVGCQVGIRPMCFPLFMTGLIPKFWPLATKRIGSVGSCWLRTSHGTEGARTCRTPTRGTAKRPFRGYAKPRPIGRALGRSLNENSRFSCRIVADATQSILLLFSSTFCVVLN